jgi:hypothetical protein
MIHGAGSTYMHWITLFESLDDDLFDGRLGEDDYEIPRVLVEYSVVGGNYTSIVNKMGQLKDKVKDHEEEIQGMKKKPSKHRVAPLGALPHLSERDRERLEALPPDVQKEV